MSARDALKPLIIAAKSPAQLDALAADLAAIAAELQSRAEAQRRQQARPAAERVTTRKSKAGPGRAPAAFIRLAHEPWGKEGRDRLHMYVGRGLWYAIGSPARLDLQRVGGHLILRPASGDAGLAFQAGKGIPRAFVDGWADLLGLDDGRYEGRVEGGAIVIGGRID